MSVVRIKQQMPSPDVTGARSRLEDVLQNLVEQADRIDESGHLDDGSPDSPDDDSKLDVQRDLLKGKRSKRSGKKRHREYSGSIADTSLERGKTQYSYVMKLFDRSVDLAQFKPSSTLYPVCREWMINRPGMRRPTSVRVPTPEPPSDVDEDLENSDQPKDVYVLPPATISADAFRQKHGKNPRIPSPVPQPEDKLDIHVDTSPGPSPEVLLQDHLTRWRKIRHKWKNASEDYQARHNESYVILKAMYDRQ